MTTRRTFLQFIGMTPAVAPIAAKSLADAELTKLAGMDPTILAPSIDEDSYGFPSRDDKEYVTRLEQARAYLKMFGPPEHIKAEARRRAQYIEGLDPDLAFGKRSWSMAVKVQEQRQRNYHRKLESLTGAHSSDLAEAAFKKISGFKWPW